MYSGMAEEEDKKTTESWKAGAEGILVFVRLYPLISYFTLTHLFIIDWFIVRCCRLLDFDVDSGPPTEPTGYVQLLPYNIYQTIADPSRSNISRSLPASLPPFSPPTYAVWVNSLWFLSLVTSITCALLATLLQQWARGYLKATQPRYSLHKRARHRSFFFEGVEKCFLPSAVEALPTLLHLSVFLFFFRPSRVPTERQSDDFQGRAVLDQHL